MSDLTPATNVRPDPGYLASEKIGWDHVCVYGVIVWKLHWALGPLLAEPGRYAKHSRWPG